MGLTRLSLTDFRNLQPVTLDFNGKLNLIHGDNGSGKSSLLEAIHILCLGKSFRTKNLNICIQHEKEAFLLVSQFDRYKVGIARDKDKTDIRVDGETIRSASGFVERTPIVIIDSSSFGLVTGPPAARREYIDWCVFHVEHSYRVIWRDYARALKQKNILLRGKRDLKQIDYWNELLASLCVQISNYRRQYLDLVVELIKNNELVGNEFDLAIEYKPGWKNLDNPKQDFEKQKERELRYGFSIVGAHRDRINIKAKGKAAIDVLSRGQIKRLTIAMIMAQVQLLAEKANKSVIACVDDLAAELDVAMKNKAMDSLLKIPAQLFITNTEEAETQGLTTQDYQMFHVEHGMIRPVQNS